MCQRARPTPGTGTGNGDDGSAVTRQRVTAAVGCPKSAASVWRRQRRMAMPSVPELSAESCNRREAVIDRRATSATTALRPPWRSPLLETGEYGLVVAGLDIDDAVRRQTGLRQRRREQIWPRHAPQHLSPHPGSDAGGKQRSRRAMNGAVAATRHLMQRAERQPASGSTRSIMAIPNGST